MPSRSQGAPNRPFCGAKNRQGAPCRRPPAVGRTRCRLHGGSTPRGWQSPHWKHGRYSSATRLLFPRPAVSQQKSQRGYGGENGEELLLRKALAESRGNIVVGQPHKGRAPGHAVSERTKRRRQQRLRAELAAEMASLEQGPLGRRLRRRRMPWANASELWFRCWLAGGLEGGRPKDVSHRCTKRLGSRLCWNWRAAGSDRCWRHQRRGPNKRIAS
jgi:hypothetical protein